MVGNEDKDDQVELLTHVINPSGIVTDDGTGQNGQAAGGPPGGAGGNGRNGGGNGGGSSRGGGRSSGGKN